jgi:predicted CoA-binding protein
MTTTTAVQRLFLSSAHFAVVGASADRSKFGNKVLRWYMTHGLDVVPINPVSRSVMSCCVQRLMEISKKLAQVEGLNTIGGLDDLPSPTSTSVSIITPPSVCAQAV